MSESTLKFWPTPSGTVDTYIAVGDLGQDALLSCDGCDMNILLWATFASQKRRFSSMGLCLNLSCWRAKSYSKSNGDYQSVPVKTQ
jgi:hypothetical protein